MSDSTPISKKQLPYSSQLLEADDLEAVMRVLESEWITTGPAVEAFEIALAEKMQARFAIAVNSGTDALHTAYAAAGLGAGDQVVTSPLTFVATASAALMLGADVAFADVDPGTGLIDPQSVAAQLEERTRLVVAVDYSGHPAGYDALREQCRGVDATLVGDAAHSLGASVDGRMVGTLADVTTLSFHPVKSITTGEGGAVVTDSVAIADKARRFRNHGIVREPASLERPGPAWYYEVQSLGMNYRIPDILCALGTSQIGQLARFVERRRALAARYSEALADLDSLMLPVEAAGVRSSWHLYVVRVVEASRRDTFFDALRAKGLNVQLHYIPVYLHPYFEQQGYRRGLCPVAERFAGSALSLPLYPAMSDADAERVIETVIGLARDLL